MTGTNQPLVTILMNCYNSEKFLKHAIDSIYNQTYQNFEIIFIDNCSTDNSQKIAKSYDSRLRYHKTPKLIPLYAARAYAKKFFRGKYITFLDCDDVWLKTKLEYQVSRMEEENIDLMYTKAGLLYMSSNKWQRLASKLYLAQRFLFESFKKNRYISKKEFLSNYDIILQTVIMRTEKILELNFSPELNLYGDYDFFLKLFFCNDCKIYYDNKKTTLYRIHPNQLTRQSSENWLKEAEDLLNKEYKKILNHEEQQLFISANINLHKSHIDLANGNLAEGLNRLKKISNLSARNKIHYYKVLFKEKIKRYVRTFQRKNN